MSDGPNNDGRGESPGQRVADGFLLALQLVESLGARVDRDAVLRRLAGMACGEVTLVNGAEDEIADAERDRGRALTPEERQDSRRLYRTWRDTDAHLQRIATNVLHDLRCDGLLE